MWHIVRKMGYLQTGSTEVTAAIARKAAEMVCGDSCLRSSSATTAAVPPLLLTDQASARTPMLLAYLLHPSTPHPVKRVASSSTWLALKLGLTLAAREEHAIVTGAALRKSCRAYQDTIRKGVYRSIAIARC